MYVYTPYTYLIGWSNQQKYYYGVRYAQGCHPNDLWESYFTSSKGVEEMQKQYGEPDIIEIRKTFVDESTAIKWEHKVLNRMNIHMRSDFLNEACWPAINNKGRKRSKETREKISKIKTGVKWGYHSEESKKQIANSNKGLRRSKKTCDNISKSKIGHEHSWNRKSITINGITYSSYTRAAKALGICRATFRKRYIKQKNLTYGSKKIIIDGVEYASHKDAIKLLDISKSTFYRRYNHLL